MENPNDMGRQVQTDAARKRGAVAYLRYRVDKLLDALILEYLDAKLRWAPAALVKFQEDEKPSTATRTRIMINQDEYEKSLAGT